MGFAANQARLLMLIARQRDLELEAQFISQHKMYMSSVSTEFLNLHSRLDPNSQAARILNARISALKTADLQLEMRLNIINNQIKAIEKDAESTQARLDKNIERSFGGK